MRTISLLFIDRHLRPFQTMARWRVTTGGSFLFFRLRGMYGLCPSWKQLRRHPYYWLQRICSDLQRRMGSYTSLPYVSLRFFCVPISKLVLRHFRGQRAALQVTNQPYLTTGSLSWEDIMFSNSVFNNPVCGGFYRSLVNCITSNQSSQVSLNSCRNAFTMVRCLVRDVTEFFDSFRQIGQLPNIVIIAHSRSSHHFWPSIPLYVLPGCKSGLVCDRICGVSNPAF